MESALVIVHLSSLDSVAARDGLEEAWALSGRLVDAVLAHAGPIYVVDQRWPYEPGASDPRYDFVRRVELQRDIRFVHFQEDRVPWDLFLEEFARELRADGVRSAVLGGAWYSPEGAGCVADTQQALRDAGIRVRVNPRLVACVAAG